MLDLRNPSRVPLVAASILAADFGFMIDDCRRSLDAGADLLHVDVMDGHFVSNLTLGPDMIRALRTHLPDTVLDVHLMVDRPHEYIDPFAKAGASVFNFHLEVCSPFHPHGPSPDDLIQRIKGHGMLAGMTVNPYTSAWPLEAYLDRLDLVLLMSVVPGAGGQKFMPHVLEQARWLDGKRRAQTRLEIDGGINAQTAPQARDAGIDTLVAGSAVFGADDRQAIIAKLRGQA